VTEQLVSFRHVGAGYDNAPVVDDVSFTLTRGEFVGIVGPSAAGKTTVLRLLLGLLAPSYGSVAVGDLRIGYVPHVETVDWSFPITVREVVELARPAPRLPWRRSEAFSAGETDDLLTALGVGDLADRHISELSGGQQQRVFLARAMLGAPDVLVLDEPASGVDVASRHELLHLLGDLHRDGVTILLTTHDLNGLAAHLPRLICFNRTVVADGPAVEVLHPYVLERTYGAPMEVLQHGGMPVVLEPRSGPHTVEET